MNREGHFVLQRDWNGRPAAHPLHRAWLPIRPPDDLQWYVRVGPQGVSMSIDELTAMFSAVQIAFAIPGPLETLSWLEGLDSPEARIKMRSNGESEASRCRQVLAMA